MKRCIPLAVAVLAGCASQQGPAVIGVRNGVTPASIAAADGGFAPIVQADIDFMSGMIGHHAQAVEMVALIKDRTANPAMNRLGLRIQISQDDEMNMMRKWLADRGAAIPGPHSHHEPGGFMPGMLTTEEMDKLAAAKGVEFDRLFLQGMIKHHSGAILMVEDLFKTPGAGQEGGIFAFASDVDSDQRMEIDRMGLMLKELTK